MKSSAECAVEGLWCETSVNRKPLLHLRISSSVVHIAELKDFLSVRRCSRTAMPCRMCEVNKEDVSPWFRAPKSCWKNVQRSVRKNFRWKRAISHLGRIMGKMLLLLFSPVLVKFSFVGVYENVNVYALFSFESMQNLPLRKGRASKDCYRTC